METSFGSESGDASASKHYLSGWCPECGRRRGADARCKNCDPWWTSPLVQAGVPAVLGVLFLVTTTTTILKQAQPRAQVVIQSQETSRLVTIKVPRSYKEPQASNASVMPSVVLPTIDPAAEALRIQREGAYINAVLRAQDEARRAQQFAARNRAYALALQQRMQAASQMRAQKQPSFAIPPFQRTHTVPSSPAPLEQVVTEETVVVPL